MRCSACSYYERRNTVKRIITVLTIFIIVMSLCAVGASTESDVKSLLVLGDSISTGYALSGYSAANPYGCASYANEVAKELGLKAKEGYINKAVNGDTSTDLLALLPNLDADLKESDLIIASIGGNDLLRAIPAIASAASGKNISGFEEAVGVLSVVTPAEFEELSKNQKVVAEINRVLMKFSANFLSVAEKIKLAAPEARVIFLKQYNPMKNVTGIEALGDFADTIIKTINLTIETVCNQFGFETADIPSVIDADAAALTNISKLDIHPNAKGHAKIAELLIKQIAEKSNTTESESVTEEPTESVANTANVTESTANETSGEKQSGCASVVSGAALLVTVLSSLFFIKKKD